MFRERRKIPVFHEKELEEVLEKFHLLEKMENNELKCSICNIIISQDNFGCLFLSKEGNVKVSCSNPECLEKVSMEVQDVS